MDVLQELVKVVGRSFYEDRHVILLDMLLRDQVLRDDAIAFRFRTIPRESNRILAKLREDRIIKCETRTEKSTKLTQNVDSSKLARSFYFIDYKQLVDAVKYKVYKMRTIIGAALSNDTEKGYCCSACKKQYSTLEAQSLLDLSTHLFYCENCKEELIAVEPVKQKTPLNHSKFMEQISLILELLKKADQLTIPIFNLNKFLDEKEKLSAEANIPQASPIIQTKKEEKVIIEFGKVEETKKELPIWHTHSTITGELVRPKKKLKEDSSLDTESIDIQHLESQIALNSTESFKIATEVKLPQAVQSSAAVVMVKGAPKLLLSITEEDKDLMTSEEYVKYYEAYMQINN